MKDKAKAEEERQHLPAVLVLAMTSARGSAAEEKAEAPQQQTKKTEKSVEFK